MIGRRDFSVGSAVTLGLLATQVSACQPPPEYEATGRGLQKALAAAAQQPLAKLFAVSATLSVIDAKVGIQTVSGPQKIADYLLKLIHEEGYHFAPNTTGKYTESEEILAWEPLDDFEWQKATLWRPVSDDGRGRFYALDGCYQFITDSYNVLVSGSPIQSIALIRSDLPEELKKVVREHDASSTKKAS